MATPLGGNLAIAVDQERTLWVQSRPYDACLDTDARYRYSM